MLAAVCSVYGSNDKIKIVRPMLKNTSSLFSNAYKMQ